MSTLSWDVDAIQILPAATIACHSAPLSVFSSAPRKVSKRKWKIKKRGKATECKIKYLNRYSAVIYNYSSETKKSVPTFAFYLFTLMLCDRDHESGFICACLHVWLMCLCVHDVCLTSTEYSCEYVCAHMSQQLAINKNNYLRVCGVKLLVYFCRMFQQVQLALLEEMKR